MNWNTRYAMYQEWRREPEYISKEHEDMEASGNFGPGPEAVQHIRDHREGGGMCVHCNKDDHMSILISREQKRHRIDKYKKDISMGLTQDPKTHNINGCPLCTQDNGEAIKGIISELED